MKDEQISQKLESEALSILKPLERLNFHFIYSVEYMSISRRYFAFLHNLPLQHKTRLFLKTLLKLDGIDYLHFEKAGIKTVGELWEAIEKLPHHPSGKTYLPQIQGIENKNGKVILERLASIGIAKSKPKKPRTKRKTIKQNTPQVSKPLAQEEIVQSAAKFQPVKVREIPQTSSFRMSAKEIEKATKEIREDRYLGLTVSEIDFRIHDSYILRARVTPRDRFYLDYAYKHNLILASFKKSPGSFRVGNILFYSPELVCTIFSHLDEKCSFIEYERRNFINADDFFLMLEKIKDISFEQANRLQDNFRPEPRENKHKRELRLANLLLKPDFVGFLSKKKKAEYRRLLKPFEQKIHEGLLFL